MEGDKHFDVIIMGAGLSGIGAACHLKENCPDKSFTILEARDSLGGTWDLFKYPGIRSDSDMFTLGYKFKPWLEPKAIADGPAILSYIKETAEEYQIEKHITYQTKIQSVSWSTENAKWTLECINTKSNETEIYTCQYLQSCMGYYNYDHGYTPKFEGLENFEGKFIHPQKWPEDLDYNNKKVVVIGSGATAVTIVPAMSDKASNVTMLQRSPSYVASVPNKPLFSPGLYHKFPMLMYNIDRFFRIIIAMLLFNLSRARPEMMKNFFIKNVRKQVPKDFDVDKHFTPKYNPWDERLCAVPNGDLFKAIRKGKVDIVTDHIDHFTKGGIKLKSGKILEADIIVSATGLDVKMLGGVDVKIDDKPFTAKESVVYKGMMLKDVPNFVFVIGYTNSSWTLKADLVSNYFCRLIQLTEKKKKKVFVVESKEHIEKEPIIDFSSGYVQRAIKNGILPQQGSKAPWKLKQNYFYDAYKLKLGKVNDQYLHLY